MRVRGRRVAWLLASALPLLADESIEPHQSDEDYNRQEMLQKDDLFLGRQHGPLELELDDLSNVHDDYGDDETLTASSLPKIPLHRALQKIPNNLPFLLDNYDVLKSYDGDDSSHSIFSPPPRVSSAAQYYRSPPSFLEDDGWSENYTCRQRPLPSMPLIRPSSSSSFNQRCRKKKPPCRVRPEHNEPLHQRQTLSTLERLEASLHSYIERVLPGYGEEEREKEELQRADDCEPDAAVNTSDEECVDKESLEGDDAATEDQDSEGAEQLEDEPLVYEDNPLDDIGVEQLLEELSTEAANVDEHNNESEPRKDEDGSAPLHLRNEDVVRSKAGTEAPTIVEGSHYDDADPPDGTDQSEIDQFINETALEIRLDVEDTLPVDSIKTSLDDEEEDEMLYERVSLDYASKSAGALIIEKSNNFKGTSNLLNGDKDKYAIAPCGEVKKSVVLSLSEDILVKVIKLANYERFSSSVKDFQVLGSQTLGKWVDLGTYRAQPGHGEQIFPLINPSWARYLKFKFLTHHGVEYYCTVSQIKVHGSTMVQGFHEQWEKIEEENDDTEDPATAQKNEDGSSSSEKISSINSVDESSGIDYTNTHVDASSVLSSFESSSTLFRMLGGELSDDGAVSEFYNRMPSALGTIPAISRSSAKLSPKRDSIALCEHKVTLLAMQPIISNVEQCADGEIFRSGKDSGKYEEFMMVPKMDDLSSELLQHRFGNGLPQGIAVNLSQPLPPIFDAARNKASDELQESEIGELKSVAGDAAAVHQPVNNDGEKVPLAEGAEKSLEMDTEQNLAVLTEFDTGEALDATISKLLKELPSADCLGELNFTKFKASVTAARKQTGQGTSQGGGMMEPIFKKLMNEIFSLQTSVSIHDQFTKASVACYQRVLLDLAMELEKVREDQEERLSRLEMKMQEPSIVRFFSAMFQLIFTCMAWVVRRLPYWYVGLMNNVVVPLLGWCRQKSEIAFRCLLPIWRQVRGYLNLSDSSTRFDKFSKSVLHLLDDFVNRYSETFGVEIQDQVDPVLMTPGFLSAWSSYPNGGIWAYPVIPVLLVLLICRIIMCCTSSSSTPRFGRTYLSPRSKEKRMSPPKEAKPTLASQTFSPSPVDSAGCKEEIKRGSQSPIAEEDGLSEASSPTSNDASVANLTVEEQNVENPERNYENGHRPNGEAPSPTVVSDIED